MENVLIFDSIESFLDYSEKKGKMDAFKVIVRYSAESYWKFYISSSEKALFESLLLQGNMFRLDFYEYKHSLYVGNSNYINPSKLRNVWVEKV